MLCYYLRMKIQDYFCDRGGQARLVRELGVHQPDVSLWFSGKRRIPVKYCLQIEKLSNGKVSCEEMRPDLDWKWWRSPTLGT